MIRDAMLFRIRLIAGASLLLNSIMDVEKASATPAQSRSLMQIAAEIFFQNRSGTFLRR